MNNHHPVQPPTEHHADAEQSALPTQGLLRYATGAVLIVLGTFILADWAWAAPPASPEDDLQVVAAALRAQNPGTKIDSVQRSPVAGLYEVVMGRNVAYMDATGRFALFGHIWDMQVRRDLTADRKALLDRVDVGLLDKSAALRHVKGKGTRTVYVFADPQCGYCRQQEQVLAALEDVTVYTFVLPILGPESRRVAAAIQCAADPAQAWTGWMLNAEQPPAPAAGCAPTTEAVEQMAKSLGINSTPTLITADGRKSAGAMGASQLTAWINAPVAQAAPIAEIAQEAQVVSVTRSAPALPPPGAQGK